MTWQTQGLQQGTRVAYLVEHRAVLLRRNEGDGQALRSEATGAPHLRKQTVAFVNNVVLLGKEQ